MQACCHHMGKKAFLPATSLFGLVCYFVILLFTQKVEFGNASEAQKKKVAGNCIAKAKHL